MSQRNWAIQIGCIAIVALSVRFAFRKLVSHSHVLQPQVEATMDDHIIHPVRWLTHHLPDQNKPASNTVRTLALTPAHTFVTPLSSPPVGTVVATPATPAAAKKSDEKKKKLAAAKKVNPFANFNPYAYMAQQPAPTAAPAPAAPAAPQAGGSAVLGGPVTSQFTPALNRGSGSGAGANASPSAQQAISQYFPQGYTQTAMTQFISAYQENKVSAAVYYEVLTEAANSGSAQTQSLVVTALVATPSSEAFTLLAKMTEQGPSSSAQSQVQSAIAQYATAQTLPYLQTPLESTDATVRFRAVEQLAAGAQTLASQISTYSNGSTPSRTTASTTIATLLNGFIQVLKQIQPSESNQQNQQAESTTLAELQSLVSTVGTAQAYMHYYRR